MVDIKTLNFIALLIMMTSCASTPQVETKKPLNIQEKLKECDEGNGLACSQLAYFYKKNADISKAIDFNKKGCELNDQIACFNLKNLEEHNQYDVKVSSKIRFYGDQAVRCYKKRPYPPSTSNISGREVRVSFKVNFLIDDQGNPTNLSVNVQNRKDTAFEKCAEEIFKEVRLPLPSKSDKREYEFNFTLFFKE